MLEFADSFGIYTLAIVGTPGSFAPSQESLLTRWNTLGGSPTMGVLANQGNRGNPALYLPLGATLAKSFTRQATFTVGFRLNMGCVAGVGNATISLIDFCAVNTQVGPLASLLVEVDGSILVFGNNILGTVICTAPAATIVANTDCYLEFSATISGSTNLVVAAEVRVNGVAVASGSASIGRNVNTLAAGVAAFNSMFLNSGVATNGQAYISDFYLNNGTGTTNTGFVAGTISPYAEVGYLLPRADGSELDWTPLSGSVHYTEINEIPQDGDTTYVWTATPGNVDSYHWQAIATFDGTIASVQISYCASSDAEGLRTFRGNVGPGGSQGHTAEFGLCSGNYYKTGAFDLDPSTNHPWTQADFNSRELGIGLVR